MSLHISIGEMAAVIVCPTPERVRRLHHKKVGIEEPRVSDFRHWLVEIQDHLGLEG